MINPETAKKGGRLSVGTYGWDYDSWLGSYYPEELPEEWRLAYYCNDYRSVLIPANHWQTEPEKSLREIAAEIDSDFSLVLELPTRGMSTTKLTEELFFDLLQGFGNNLVALCWRPAQGTLAREELHWFKRLAALFPAVLDYASDRPDLDQLAAECGASRLWRPQQGDPIPELGGFLLALVEHPDLVFLRTTIERMGAWLADGGNCGLFFEETADAPQQAKQCRILADLLEI